MTSKFLARLFSAGDLPTPVLESALETYGSRYLGAFTLNQFLGPVAATLTNRLLDNEDDDSVISLIRTKNLRVVRTLQSRQEILADKVVLAVLDVWNLSHADSSKLSVNASNNVNKLLVKYASDIPRQYLGPAKRTKLRMPPDRERRPLTTGGGADGRALVSALAYYQDFPLISPILREALGDGSSELSMTSWRNFFGLAEGDPAVTLQTVLDTARRLALAEN